MKRSSISLKGVGRRWGERIALADIDLTLEAGEFVALVGPSGSGKTTLLRLLTAGLSASEGSIDVDGRAIGSMRPKEVRSHRKRCALIDQGLQVFPRMTVHDNVIAGRVAGWPWWRTLLSTFVSLDRDEVHRILGDVGLADRQWDRADELSGGQQQRVAIARALSGTPDWILADEPTAALDPTTSGDVIDLLVRESKKRRATLLISTHRASQVVSKVDRVIGLRATRLVLDKPAAHIESRDLDELYAGSSERS